MNPTSHPLTAPQFPDSDGEPMADNTLQFEWITTLKWGLETLFTDRDDVFVAGDHLIFTDPEDDEVRIVPDVYVAFGRPKGYRGSYKVWEEDNVFPQVVFEVWSPTNRYTQMQGKLRDYERLGAEEYYIIYPERPAYVDAWVREEGRLEPVKDLQTWVSPLLGIRFEFRRGAMNIRRPDGTRFLTYLEINDQLKAEQKRADAEKARADAERARADAERARAEKLAARLRELGLDPDAG